MARYPSEDSSRSQRYGSKQQTTSTNHPPRSRRNVEEQRPVKSRFSAKVTQMRLTIFIILASAITLTSIAFFTSNWLEVERRYYGSKFKKLGLWQMCFNSFSAPDDFQFKKFYVGCRWIFAEEYRPIRKFLLPGSLKNIHDYLSNQQSELTVSLFNLS